MIKINYLTYIVKSFLENKKNGIQLMSIKTRQDNQIEVEREIQGPRAGAKQKHPGL